MSDSPENLERLQLQLSELDLQEQQTAKAQIDAMMKGRNVEVYDTLLDDINAKRKTVKAQIDSLESSQKITPDANIIEDAERIAEVMRRVSAVLTAEELTPAEKQVVLSSLIKAIKPEGEGYSVELRSFNESSHIVPSVQMISMACPPGASR